MSFVFEVPNNVIFGCGVSEQVVEWAERLNGRSVMVVCDPGVKAAGIAGPLLLSVIYERTHSYSFTLYFFSACFVVSLLLAAVLKLKGKTA